MANQSAAANRRPAGQLDGSGNLSATVAADRALPAAVAELGRYTNKVRDGSGRKQILRTCAKLTYRRGSLIAVDLWALGRRPDSDSVVIDEIV
jgi:hypothetical protein